MRSFKKINTDVFDIQRVQENVATSFADLVQIPFLNGTAVQTTLNNATDTSVEHGLGRDPLGYFVTSCSSPGGAVFESTTVNNLRSKFLYLRATATVSMNLWIF